MPYKHEHCTYIDLRPGCGEQHALSCNLNSDEGTDTLAFYVYYNPSTCYMYSSHDIILEELPWLSRFRSSFTLCLSLLITETNFNIFRIKIFHLIAIEKSKKTEEPTLAHR